jgi:hypothetical protein
MCYNKEKREITSTLGRENSNVRKNDPRERESFNARERG